MAVVCPNCGSADTQALVDKNQCLNCGVLLTIDTNEVASTGADQNTKDIIAKSLAPREVNIVGNFADLQRAGAVGHFDSTNNEANVGGQTDAAEAANAAQAEQAQATTPAEPTPPDAPAPSGDEVTTTTTQSWGTNA